MNGRGICPVCGDSVRINVDGSLRYHAPLPGGDCCPGSRGRPRTKESEMLIIDKAYLPTADDDDELADAWNQQEREVQELMNRLPDSEDEVTAKEQPQTQWLRARFLANHDDSRPVKWPPPGPFWETGLAGDGSYATVVAYVRTEGQIVEFWPEAREIEFQHRESIMFTDRFPSPDWWLKEV